MLHGLLEDRVEDVFQLIGVPAISIHSFQSLGVPLSDISFCDSPGRLPDWWNHAGLYDSIYWLLNSRNLFQLLQIFHFEQ